jgi:flagellar basal-body rod protein FlgF
VENSIIIGLSRQVALSKQMDTIANNLANMTTTGYRGQNVIFSEYLSKPEGMKDSLSMVLDYGQYQNNAAGSMIQTGNQLDVAVQGPGYFTIQGKDGQFYYTRAGNFAVNGQGQMVTVDGDLVAADGGGAINIPAEAQGTITVSEDGTVTSAVGRHGRIRISEFDNYQELDPIGNNLYKTDQRTNLPVNTTVQHGMLEGSNVNPVTEMTRMIEVSRNYESAQNLMKTEHDRQRTMIQELAKV